MDRSSELCGRRASAWGADTARKRGLSCTLVESKPLVIQLDELADEPARWLSERCRVVSTEMDSAEFRAAAPAAEGLLVRTRTRVDAGLLDQLPRLRVVGRGGVGLDSIDVEQCRRRGVVVVSTPDANTQAVVEYVLCLLCDALRPRLFLDRAVDAREWNELREEVVGLWQMDELRLGILGLGRIGRRVAEVARAIGFEVVYNDLVEISAERRGGANPVPLQELFAESDVITLHCDGRASNCGFVDAGLLALMRPDAILINTSRGFVIDSAALAAFLRANPAAMALLDVHANEPFDAACPLLGVPNAHLAPHLASRTVRATEAMSWVVRDLWSVLEGAPPKHPAW